MRTTLAVGYDAVVPIDPISYEITEDAAGRAYAFDMADAREDVAEVVRSTLDGNGAVDTVEVTPGYVRVRVAPSGSVPPKDLLEALRSVPDTYNRHHATAPDLDGLAFDSGHYLGTYRPEDRPTEEAYLDRYASGDAVPDSDGPVFTYRRDDAGEDALQSNRRLWYRAVFPFDPQMYEQSEMLGVTGDPPVRWGPDAVQTALRATVEDLPAWPGRSENTPLVAVYPGYLLVEHATASITDAPDRLGERIGSAFARYNRYRNVDEEHSTRNEDQLHPPIEFSGEVYVATPDASRTTRDWISDHALDAVDSGPDHDRGDDAPEDADAGGIFDAFM